MFLEHLLDIAVPIIIHLLESMGVFIIFFSAIKAFFQYACRIFDFSDESIKINFARALALGLEFKMGAEILKTLLIRTIDEILILASIVIIRIILTFVIHWEIKSETTHHQ